MTDVVKIVEGIKETCLNKGQNGLLDLCKKFDKLEGNSLIFNIPDNVKVDKKLQKAIKTAIENITKFHKAEFKKLQSFQDEKVETTTGIVCWRKFTPIENVGVYVPNMLFSSALMNIIPAQIAGCKNIVVCTPPNPSNAILYALKVLGIDKIYTIGGAQAIFAMAYGIGEIPKVDKIFGPGNEFVDTAKKMVSQFVAIDMPAGPSEVLVITDETAKKEDTMYDLLAQLEHGRESKAWLFTTDKQQAEWIKNNITRVAELSNRWFLLEKSLNNLRIEVVKNLDEAIEKSNNIAPEHLIINVKNAAQVAEKIINAGSVFIGGYASESLGDYLSGTNHVLPTSGFARGFSGLSVLSFGKFITFQNVSKEGLKTVGEKTICMAKNEGLGFHAESIASRINDN
ncbi:MAG: histidinol dehydrogenase [Rickettsiales bacterium]|nr:histidinol dehydrogenase [Rickettsiales bacterium]